MRGYELCIILHPEISEEDIDTLINNIGTTIKNLKGTMLKVEKWGKKNFKYYIKKHLKGHYCFLSFMGNNEIISAIENDIKYNESVLRYNNIRLEKNIPAVDSEIDSTIQAENDTTESPNEHLNVPAEEQTKPTEENHEKDA